MGAISLQILRRHLPRVLHVLRTEGPRALAKKLKRRLRTTPLRINSVPRVYHLERPWPALKFPSSAAPTVSIVIPVYNGYKYTFHCLYSIANAGASTTFEVIIIDDCSTDETAVELTGIDNVTVVTNIRNLGYVRACNRGAKAAAGKYLVFLNNDTQVQSGWLDALVDTLETFPGAGVAGSRLLYPDGRQQEAGGILFRDGSAWNLGHLDDPGKPAYSYAREVDYVSGASLAIRRHLFDRLGGFDNRFAPGYYEDADLAFRVRAVGLRVIYQPLSQVVHWEGATAGKDENAPTGMKRFQRLNQAKLVERWHRELSQHGVRGENIDQQRDRRVRLRALVVDVYMLTPDKESGSLRMVNLISILQGFGYKVSFAAANLEACYPYTSQLQRRGVEVLYRPYVRSVEAHLRTSGAIYDLVILSRPDSALRFMDSARKYCRNARIVYDTVDLHFLREQRLARLTQDRVTRLLAERCRRDELDLIARADLTWVVSAAERDILAGDAPGAAVWVVSNVHHIPGSRRRFGERRDIFFIGAFSHPPNIDAVVWFGRDIFPLIAAEEPSLRCLIIGDSPPAQVRSLASNRMHILGHVADLTPYLDGCRLSVAPIRYGAGVKGKISQSLAHGIPVVATSVATEGMFLVDGESVLSAERPDDFARAVLRAYRDEALWQQLSSAGVAVMKAHFSFDAARSALRGLADKGPQESRQGMSE